MRTTVTLDADTEQLLRRQMEQRRVSFKQAINDAIRSALAVADPMSPFATETASLGQARVSLDGALQLSAELEDDELARKLERGS